MTELLYQTNAYLKEFSALITAVDPETRAVALDRSAFYPGGGGQPCDFGTLEIASLTYPVEKVKKQGEDVQHFLGGENALPPINSAATFAPTDEIYVTFDVNEVATGAAFQIRWYALDIEGQDPETPFTTSDYTYNDESSIYAQIYSTEGGFPAGQYKVEIYLDGSKVGEQQFSVQ